MKIDNLEKLFESVYNESLQRFTEIGKDNFWAKINANKTGKSYAQSFLQLDRTGQTTPINLSGNLKKERYNWGNDVVNGTQHFTKNGDFNSFLIEKIYEELLLDRGRNVQDLLRNFFNDFKDELQNAGLAFSPLNLVDYEALVA